MAAGGKPIANPQAGYQLFWRRRDASLFLTPTLSPRPFKPSRMLSSRTALRLASKRIAAPARSSKSLPSFSEFLFSQAHLSLRAAQSRSPLAQHSPPPLSPRFVFLHAALPSSPRPPALAASRLRLEPQAIQLTSSSDSTARKATYATETGKFSRALPHMNIGTIGHVRFASLPLVNTPELIEVVAGRSRQDDAHRRHHEGPGRG